MMCRLVSCCILSLVCLFFTAPATAEPARDGLVHQSTANRYGLERAWFSQIRLTPGGRGIVDLRLHVSNTSAQTLFRVVSDQGPTYTYSDRNLDAFGEPLGEEGAGKAAAEKARLLRLQGIESRIEQAVLPDIMLFATTGNGMIQAFEAETGQLLWSTAVGSVYRPTTPPAVTEGYLGVVNGQKLFILDTKNGKILTERRVVGAPGAGPTIVNNIAYVPLMNGHLRSYRFGPDSDWWPETYYSSGAVEIQPTAAGDRVVWANKKGDISVLTAGRHGLRYRLRLNEPAAGPVIYSPPNQLLAVTTLGNLYSFQLEDGQLMWRFACGDETAKPAAIVGDRVFMTTRYRGIFTVSATAGKLMWPQAFVPGRKFVAATVDRVYCTTSKGDLAVLDAETGNQVGRIPMNLNDICFTNNQTDRIYLSTSDGALQCLHELGADLPTLHVADQPEEAPKTDASEGEPDTDTTPPKKPVTNPFEEDTNPFGTP